MQGKNIELFDKFVLEIMWRLYETFPNPVTFDCTEVTEKDYEKYWVGRQQHARLRDENEVLVQTAYWLYIHGLIINCATSKKYENKSPVNGRLARVQDATLSKEGLRALRATPKSLKGESIVDVVKKARDAGTVTMAKEATKHLFNVGVGLIDTFTEVPD